MQAILLLRGSSATPIIERSRDTPRERRRSEVPYCFILDDDYRVIMSGPSGWNDPLARMYDTSSGTESLPEPVDRVVRALTATWRFTQSATSRSAAVNEFHVTVSALHGREGRRIAVFVQRAEPSTATSSGVVGFHHRDDRNIS